MNIIVNGETKETRAENIQDLLVELAIQDKVMAAAINMEIVKKENWATTHFCENDRIEFLQFVGGG
ncbi:MAG: sulfur carrier protein ThiS [Sulfurospirillum sp.]|nr:sulfur carrier protein ThiS [Sulfurospirillum sp.]